MKKAKLNIPICAALVLLFLTMVSIHMTSGLYARYTTSDSAHDSARVAKFAVESVLTPVENENGKFTLTVTNNSEVAVQYKVEVEFSAPMSVALNSGDAKELEGDATSITFSDTSWTLAPGAEADTHTLQFSLNDWSYITKNANNVSEWEESLDFTVNVTAEQID